MLFQKNEPFLGGNSDNKSYSNTWFISGPSVSEDPYHCKAATYGFRFRVQRLKYSRGARPKKW